MIAAAVGLGLTALSVRHPPGIDIITDGAWTAIASEGAPEVDAYALAALAFRGEVPLPIADGLSFRAKEDDDGRPLSGSCRYVVSGEIPPVRLWSLATFDTKGEPFSNPAQRRAYTNSNSTRDAKGAVQISLASVAQPGDWIPVRQGMEFVLVLRLYDTTAAAISGGRSAPELPAIKRLGCD